MGVIWGEGMADHRRPASHAGVHAYIERLLRTVRRWLFLDDGEDAGETAE